MGIDMSVDPSVQWAGFCAVAAVLAGAALAGIAWAVRPKHWHRCEPASPDVALARDLGARLVDPIPAEHEHLSAPPEQLYDQRRDVGWMQQLLTPRTSVREIGVAAPSGQATPPAPERLHLSAPHGGDVKASPTASARVRATVGDATETHQEGLSQEVGEPGVRHASRPPALSIRRKAGDQS